MSIVDDNFFPASPRVLYANAPLTQVICQLKFPPILRIDSQPPADFQDRIRNIFPFVEKTANQLTGIPPEIAQALGIAGAMDQSAGYAFKTEDGKCTLKLESQLISLSTISYRQWGDFFNQLRPALDALVEIYKPSFFQRVGIRYINTIQRSTLGIPDRSWSELLRRELLGEIALPQFEAAAADVKRNIRITFPSDPTCAMFLQHGYAKRTNTSEILYRIDLDLSRAGKTEVADVKSHLDSFNTLVGYAFRWCITPTLHTRLGPNPMELAASA